MIKNLLLIFILLSAHVIAFSQGSFAPAVGYTGTSAIYKDSSAVKSWATGIELKRGWVNISNKTFQASGSNLATYGTPTGGLLKADNNLVSLGDSGVATLTFDRPIINGEGPDFTVFENGFFLTNPSAFLELAFTEVSSDGIHFVRFPATTEVPAATQIGSFAGINATYIHNFAGKYTADYGTPFDLEDVKGSANLDVNNIRFVRLVDAIGNVNALYSVSTDSKGNAVNDPFPTAFNSSGFDLDAVGVINSGSPYSVSTFNDLTLAADTFYNPKQTGSFQSGNVSFPYNQSAYSWDGFAYSNKTDKTTGTNANQYSAITGTGIDGVGTNYAVSYVTSDWTNYKPIPNEISFTDGNSYAISGFYATNSTYAYFTMKNGSAYSKVFGGASGSDPDWFKIIIWGEKEDGSQTDSVEFYLADFRFAEDTLDYFVTDWRWVDLNKLGVVKKVKFSIESSDAGDYGINIPTYFCMDNLTVIPASSTTEVKPVESLAGIVKVFPNPFTSLLTVDCNENSTISLFDVFGRKIMEQTTKAGSVQIPTDNLKKGYYVIKVENKKGSITQKIVKQ